MNQALKVLVVDDELGMRESLAAWLRKEGHQVGAAAGGPEALAQMDREPSDLLLVDMKMPGMDGLELLHEVKQRHPDTLVVIVTAYGSVENAVQAMKEGAEDYLLKPFDPEALMLLVDRLARHKRLLEENRNLKERLAIHERNGGGDLLAASPAMLRVLALVKDVAPTNSTVLLSGETGSGKELVARALHTASRRAFGPFVAINCGAQSESLLESELFGHEKGAFTGAVRARRGHLEIADGGTLFLDEVGEIPLKMQVDLLRVLEEKTFHRVGGGQPITSDFRLVAATHRDLATLVENGQFRPDFFYRINVVSIRVPPLRERPEDIGLLAEYFLKRFGGEIGKRLEGFTPRALELLGSYAWPGNVRELKNVIERAVVLAKGELLGERELSFLAGSGRSGADQAELEPLTLEQVERRHIGRTLKAHGGNVTRAALTLGIDRRTLTRKMKRYQLRAGA